MPIEYYFIAALASVCAGFINTLAGNGSAITLYFLMYVAGIPAQAANATIRVGVFAMTLAALPTFQKKGHLKLGRDWLIVFCMTLGAVLGIITVLYVSNSFFKEIFKYLFFVMLALALLDTKSWLRNTDHQKRLSSFIIIPLYIAVGFYGGFIQMGVGVFFLFVTVLGARYNIIDAAALKLASISSYTLLAVIIFAYNGLIYWYLAAAMAAGEMIGGRLGAHFATRHPKAAIWAHRLLVIVLILGIIQMFFFPARVQGAFLEEG